MTISNQIQKELNGGGGDEGTSQDKRICKVRKSKLLYANLAEARSEYFWMPDKNKAILWEIKFLLPILDKLAVVELFIVCDTSRHFGWLVDGWMTKISTSAHSMLFFFFGGGGTDFQDYCLVSLQLQRCTEEIKQIIEELVIVVLYLGVGKGQTRT